MTAHHDEGEDHPYGEEAQPAHHPTDDVRGWARGLGEELRVQDVGYTTFTRDKVLITPPSPGTRC